MSGNQLTKRLTYKERAHV